MSDVDSVSDRAAVRTYIPEHQKEEWDEDADSLDMSRSEFIRCMVQAGRHGFDLLPESVEEPANDGGERNVEFVLEALREEPYLSFDQLLERGEAELANRLDTLMEAGVIRYRPRRDGFVIVDEES